MIKIQEELKFSLQLLKREWQEDLQQYKKKFLSSSIADKKKQGVCWYPVRLISSKNAFGDRVVIELERHDTIHPHLFQSGKSVSVFSNNELYHSQDVRVNGVINVVRKGKMILTLQSDEIPEWISDGKIGVDLLFDEASYREMEFALLNVIKTEKGRLGELKEILLGAREAGFSSSHYENSPSLNSIQNQALELVAMAKDIAIIHGPPGTGKTTTLIASICQSLQSFPQIMVCAPSNAAVDLLVERLIDQQISTLRLGHPARVDDKILAQTLDAQIAQHESYRDLKKLLKSADEYKQLGRKYKRNFGHEERLQRNRLLAEAGRIKQDAETLRDYILDDVFHKTQVIACTLVGASNQALKGMRFPVVYIDEAAQGLEAATWIPIMKADKVVMAGDHCQLPPTIKSYEAEQNGLSETLFEKVISRQPLVSKMLLLQYRMPKVIMGFSSKMFYNNALEAAENTLSHYVLENEPVLEFIDTAGSGFWEHMEPDSMSKLNLEEAKFALKYLENLLLKIRITQIKDQSWNIGLISPYKAQVRKLQELIFDDFQYPELRTLGDLLDVDSIDGFQGQERDIIMISLVRSNSSGEIGFLADTRRMNVAMTRAKRKLIVIGDSATLGGHPFYNAFFEYIDQFQGYKSVFEYME